MAEIKVVNMAGESVGTMNLSDAIFAADVNGAVLHMAVKSYLGNQRQGTQSTLTRTEVSGGGKKPWRQKGTGRARQGSTRSPQWTHGGIVFAPKPRSYRTAMNRKVKRIALYSALSAKMAGNEIVVLDAITTDSYKTKTMVNMLTAVGAAKKTLVVLDEINEMVIKSFANIPGVKTVQANMLNVYDILNCDTFLMTKAAAGKIEEVYSI